MSSQLGEFFKTAVGVRQGCLLSPILFNLLWDKIMQEPLHDHHTSISIGGRPVRNRRFAEDIALVGGSSSELQDLTNILVDRAMAYGMEVSTKKSKIVTNSTINISLDNSMNGQKLEKVTSFKYLGATLFKDGICSAEVCVRIAPAVAAMARLNRICRRNTSFASKFKICKSLDTYILYGCETWTLLGDSEKKGPRLPKPSARGNISATSLWVHWNLL